MENTIIQFNLNVKQTNTILQALALSNMPYAQVVELIGELQKQASSQIKQEPNFQE